MKPIKLLTLTTSLLLCTAGGLNAAGLNFVGQNVGAPTLQGSVTKNADGTTTIVGGGDDIWNASDSCYYYFTWATGQQWDSYVRVRSLSVPNEWGKAELMVRASDTVAGPQGGDAFVANMTTTMSTYNPLGGNGVNVIGIQGRGASAGSADQWGTRSPTPIFAPDGSVWLRVIRNGSVFTMLSGTNSDTFASVTWYTNGVIDTANSTAGNDNAVKFSKAFPDLVAVGVAVTAHDNANTEGGTAVISDLNATFPPIAPPTLIGATEQPANVTNYAGSPATFRFVTTNNASPNVVIWPGYVSYQWYKNGTAIAGATSTAYTALLAPGDNGDQVSAKATVAAPYNTSVQGMTSATGTVSVLTPNVYTNGLKLEVFSGAVRPQLEAGNVGAPTAISLMDALDDNGGFGNNYARRVSGWFIPPTTDTYTFFTAGDDDSDLFLSTDSTRANMKVIAQATGWSPYRSWLTTGGGVATSSERSDSWTDTNGNPAWTAGTPLQAGQRYYIEVVIHQGGGGDNLGVTYQTATQMAAANWATIFTNGVPSLLTASNKNIAVMTGPTTFMNWDKQPANISLYEGDAAIFTASVKTDSELAPRYQWFKYGTNVPGATKSSFTISPLTLPDSGTPVYVVVQSAEENFVLTSGVATVTVNQAILEAGFAKVEWWIGATRPDIENGLVGKPDYVYATPAFEASVNNANGDNFANRISGFVIPATSTTYDFFVNGDDDCDLFLGTDDKPATKRLVAQEQAWSNARQWTTANSGLASMKRSDQWSPDNGTTTPFASGISLTAGTKYYLELVHHDGTGGDNSSATFKKHSDPDPAAGTASTLTGSVIAMYAPRCTYVAFTQQPANVTAGPMGIATFTAQGTTDSTTPVGGINAPITNNFIVYQWLKNGAIIPGATTASLAYGPVLPAESGTIFSCKIRALGLADASLTAIWSNSVSATLTVLPSVFEPGYVKAEYWQGGTRAAVEAGTLGDPTWTTYLAQWSQGDGLADNYARRYSGFFVPPANDKYAFYVNADDDADLFLSTNDNPANKRLIAQETTWGNGLLHWADTAGTQDQRKSDSWTPDAGATMPGSTGYQLQAGTKYYLEGVQHDGGGGDYLQVLFTPIANVFDVTNNQPVNMTGNAIGVWVPQISYVAFTHQPQNTTAESLKSATFTAAGVSDSTVSVSPATPPVTLSNKPILFQWFKNGTAIPGATQSTLLLSEVLPADNGAQIVAKIRALGYGDASGAPIWSNSQTATLTVQSLAPTVTAATFYTDLNATPQASYVDIGFSKRMDPATLAGLANYSATGGLTITAVTVSPDALSVKLTVTGTPAPGATVTIKAGTDAVGTALAANTVATVQQLGLTFKDIGLPADATVPRAADPTFPSVLYVEGPGQYLVKAQGSDIWNNQDGFNFLYEQKTGDFDVVVRQKSISHTSMWAKGGLMVRETVAPGSREWNIVNTPQASDGIMAPDNSGLGSSAVECNYRGTNDFGTTGWDSARGFASQYPNAWVRLKRVGQTLTAYYSTDGKNWTLAATQTPTEALPATLLVGMATTAHNNDQVGTLPADQQYWNTVPYADYNSNYVPPTAAPQLSLSVSGTQMTITWTPAVGTLQQSANMGTGSWATVPSTGGSATVTIGTGNMFFRVLAP